MASPTASGSDQAGVIKGTVVSASTNEPVKGARIVAAREGVASLQVIADASGHFVITGLTPGRYRLEVQADHFVTQAYGVRGSQASGKLVELSQGDHISNIDFRIFPCGAITGTVRDENGKPVAGATVRALSGRDIRYFQSATTNPKGEYRVSDLNPGPYILQVSHPQPSSGDERHLLPGGIESITEQPDMAEDGKRATSQNAYVCTYYPNTTDPVAAGAIPVQPGSFLSGMDVELRPVSTVRVSGRLINGVTGKPAPSGLVGLTPRTNGSALLLGGAANVAVAVYSNMTVAVNDTSGKFEFRVPSGSYWAEGQIEEPDGTLTGLVPVDVGDADVGDVVVTTGEPVQLKGQTHVEPSTPFDFSRLNISLGLAELPLPELSAQPNMSGAFAFHDLAPAMYRLLVKNLPLGYYLKSARLGGADVLDAGAALDSGSRGTLDIVLGSPGGTISGQVQEDDQPAPATVYVAPDPLRLNRPDLYFSIPTNADGTFTIAGVPPGNYKLFGLRDPDPNLTSNPVLFQPYEANGESVSVDGGTSQSVQLELISASVEK